MGHNREAFFPSQLRNTKQMLPYFMEAGLCGPVYSRMVSYTAEIGTSSTGFVLYLMLSQVFCRVVGGVAVNERCPVDALRHTTAAVSVPRSRVLGQTLKWDP